MLLPPNAPPSKCSSLPILSSYHAHFFPLPHFFPPSNEESHRRSSHKIGSLPTKRRKGLLRILTLPNPYERIGSDPPLSSGLPARVDICSTCAFLKFDVFGWLFDCLFVSVHQPMLLSELYQPNHPT